MLTLSRRIMVSAPRESVRLYLRDLKNMPDYEEKVESVSVTYPDADTAEIEMSGKFHGVSWKGFFKAEFTKDGGYRSEMTQGPLSRMALGYHLRPVSGGTIVTHEEEYQFPLLLRPFTFLIKPWLAHTMDLELGVIKEGAERLNRKLHLEQIEAAA